MNLVDKVNKLFTLEKNMNMFIYLFKSNKMATYYANLKHV